MHRRPSGEIGKKAYHSNINRWKISAHLRIRRAASRGFFVEKKAGIGVVTIILALAILLGVLFVLSSTPVVADTSGAPPDAPTGLTAVAGNANVTLNWTAPSNNGGSAINYYIIYQDGVANAGEPTGLNTTITGLTNGQPYSFSVTAHNDAGEGTPSAAVSSTPFTVPNAPTGLTAVAGNAQVILNWTAPLFDGGSAIDYYVVYQDGGALADHPTGTTTTIIGLSNGVSYTFTVTAHNLAGEGGQSSLASSTPATIPGVPTGLTAVAGNANVTLNWTAPSNNGGSAINYYIIYQDGVANAGEPTGLNITITGLTNGQSYSFTVATHTSAGTGVPSAAVSSTPFTVPNAPTGLTAVAGNANVSLNWTAPAFNGGSSINSYNVYRSDSETGGYIMVDSPSTITYKDIGLTNGQTYWFKISAVNAAGEGAMTAPAASTPYTVPNAPIGLTAIGGNANVTLNWTAPAFNGGRTIDYYVIYQDGVAQTGHPSGSTTTIGGLINGHSYSFTVTAHNQAGTGAQSAAVSSIPYTVPGSPTGLTAVAGNANVTLNWTAPINNGGSAINYYIIYQDGVAQTGQPDGSTTLITGLTNGQSYSFTVVAHSLIGTGAPSNSASATPHTGPSAPTGLKAVAGNAQVTLNWNAPAFNGGSAIDYYLVYQNGVALTGQPAGLTTTISGLTNGVSYSFMVAAHNQAGSGAQSAAVSSTPYTVPGTPTGLTAVAGNAQVSLNWTTPSFNGGSAIDYYLVYQNGVALGDHLTGTTVIISGLANGVVFSFTVTAHNLAGEGARSSPASSTPVALPGIPTGLTAVAGNAQVTLNWTAPASTGGSTIDYYIIYQDTIDVAHQTTLTKKIAGLTNGHSYSFTIAAHTPIGTGSQCAAVSSTPFTVPGSPTGLTAVAANAQVTLNWTAPAFNGGMAIDYYLIYQGGVALTAHFTGSTTTITGLTNGQSYTFNVAAHNAAGAGPNSSAVNATPYKATNPPSVEITFPANGSYSNTGSIFLSWTTVGSGSPVIKVEVRSDIATWSTVTGSNTTITGFAEGGHRLYVRVTDQAGSLNMTSVGFTVDTGAPTLTITSPGSGVLLNASVVVVSWSANDTTSGLARTEISTDAKVWTAVMGLTSSVSLPDGPDTVYLRATDKAGNTKTASVTFVVDTTAPTLIVFSPSGNSESTLTAVNVTFSETMARSATIITINGVDGTTVWNGNRAVFLPSAALNGWTTYIVTVSGKDLAGNGMRSSWTFETARVGKLSGIVTGNDGKVIVNALVHLMGHDTAGRTPMGLGTLDVSGGTDKVLAVTTTDTNGHYAFYDVAIGNYTLEIDAAGHGVMSTPVSMTAEDVAKGGLDADQNIIGSESDGTMLIMAISVLAIALVVLVFAVRRKRAPEQVVPVKKEEAKPAKPKNRPRQGKRKR